jgi:hypothetical protein
MRLPATEYVASLAMVRGISLSPAWSGKTSEWAGYVAAQGVFVHRQFRLASDVSGSRTIKRRASPSWVLE